MPPSQSTEKVTRDSKFIEKSQIFFGAIILLPIVAIIIGGILQYYYQSMFPDHPIASSGMTHKINFGNSNCVYSSSIFYAIYTAFFFSLIGCIIALGVTLTFSQFGRRFLQEYRARGWKSPFTW